MEGQVTEYLIATFRDYFSDVKTWVIYLVQVVDLSVPGWFGLFIIPLWSHKRYIEERSFRRFLEACLEETVIVYADRLLIQVPIIYQLTFNNLWTCQFPWFFSVEKLYQRRYSWTDEARWRCHHGILLGVYDQHCKHYFTKQLSLFVPWW